MVNAKHRINAQRARRVHRTRTRLAEVTTRPRLVVTRSLKHIRAQVIEPGSGRVLAAATTLELEKPGTKTEVAMAIGKLVAERALKQQVSAVVFDRGSMRYHGRVKAVAEGARAGGLTV